MQHVLILEQPVYEAGKKVKRRDLIQNVLLDRRNDNLNNEVNMHNDDDDNTNSNLPKQRRRILRFNSVISFDEFKTLIVTALIFLTVFSFVDVFASVYRNAYEDRYGEVSDSNYAYIYNDKKPIAMLSGALMPDVLHKLPKTKIPRANFENLPTKAKLGYSILLSIITLLTWAILSLTIPPAKKV